MKAAALLCLLACAGYAAACAHTYTHSRGLMAVRLSLCSAACIAISLPQAIVAAFVGGGRRQGRRRRRTTALIARTSGTPASNLPAPACCS